MRIRNPTFSQKCGSMTFSSRCLQKTNFFNTIFSAYCFLKVHLHHFCMMTEGSGSVSISLTRWSGSGSSRPKNMWIRWVRIRIHNTAFSRIRSETKINYLDPDSVELRKNFNAELLQEMSQSCEACYTGTSRTTLCNLWLLLCQQVFSQCSRKLFYQSFSQCCVTGTVGTVTYCLVEPEP